MPEEELINDPNSLNNIYSINTRKISKKKNLSGKAPRDIKTKLANKSAKVAGKGLELAGRGTEKVGKGIKKVSNTAGTALSFVPGVGKVLGGAVKAAGNVAGTGTELAGKGLEKAGKKASNKENNVKGLGDRGLIPRRKPLKKRVKDKLVSKTTSSESRDGLKVFSEKLIGALKRTVKSIKWIIRLIPILLVIIFVAWIIDYVFSIFETVDKSLRNVANFGEKLDNFMHGFGFEDSEQAFIDEMDSLNEHYSGKLDKSLLMATLFYNDIRSGLDISNYPDDAMIEAATTEDEDEKNKMIWQVISDYIADLFRESQETVSEEGLRFTRNKIYRLRKLSSKMMKYGSGEKEKIELNSYIEKIEKYYSESSKEVLSKLAPKVTKDIFTGIVCYMNQVACDNLKNTLQDENDMMIGAELNDMLDVFLGTLSVEYEVDEENNKVYVIYSDYGVDEEAYFKYLREEYIPKMPEFEEELEGIEVGSEKYNRAIEAIIDNIKSIKDDYEYFYVTEDNNKSTIFYSNNAGNIRQSVVNQLALPVRVKDGFNVVFEGDNKFGVGTGTTKNNGIYLNSESIGASAGDNVYSIYDGVIEDIPSSTNIEYTGNFDNFIFIGDSRYKGIMDELNKLGKNVYVAAVNSSTPKDYVEVTSSGTGSIKTFNDSMDINLPSTAKGISIMLGVNALSQISEMQTVIENLHTRYPNAKIYINSVYHTGNAYTGGATNDKIDLYNNTMKSYSTGKKYVDYYDISSNLYYSDGKLKDDLTNDGLHLNKKGNEILVNNIKHLSSDNTNTNLIIKHEMKLDGSKYVFYSQYGNIKIDKKIKVGDEVSKGQLLGTIDESGSLYFEFDSEDGEPQNPINIYISDYKKLVGSDDVEQMFNYFIDYGFTPAGVSAIISNIYRESGLRTNNLENPFENQGIYTDETFTLAVDNGAISLADFKSTNIFTCDSVHYVKSTGKCVYGYGIVQFTAESLKEQLYKETVEKGLSVSDLGGQLKTVTYVLELYNDNSIYDHLIEYLKTTNDPEEAGFEFSRRFERCTTCSDKKYCNVQNRMKSAKGLYDYYLSNGTINRSALSSMESEASKVDKTKCVEK